MTTILHTESSPGWGGQEMRVHLELIGLRERGHRMLLACHPESELAKRAERAGLEVWCLSFRRPIDPRLTWQMHRLLTQERVELVNTHSSVDSWVVSLAARSARVPVVRTRHLSVPLKRDPFSRLVYWTLCDRIVTTGEAIRRHLLAKLRLNPSKVISIPTGVDLRQLDPHTVDGKQVRHELGVQATTPLIGIVAVLRSWKGHRFFLEAVPLIVRKVPSARFLIVGDGPLRRTIGQWIEQMGLKEIVMMAGHREDIPEVLAALDVVVSASTAAEGVPQALLQALAMRRPVVATQVGGIPEAIRHEETGLLVSHGDPVALAAAITSLLSDPDRGASLGNAGRRLVEKEFAVETMLDRLEVLYAEMLTRNRANSRSVVPSSPPGS
ncbi:MAG: group 1 glycosyl transferase [candidate division NC10 bacterium CSP1-5]|nr:MAG: group 1 glycosyl transferase [candidate division NC10 bacterium CSP1-5]